MVEGFYDEAFEIHRFLKKDFLIPWNTDEHIYTENFFKRMTDIINATELWKLFFKFEIQTQRTFSGNSCGFLTFFFISKLPP